ncbi:putative dehydrogenase [Bacillus sp. TS-2]|nr:putative dehydrogenase [Bacillus sp. TS-2]
MTRKIIISQNINQDLLKAISDKMSDWEIIHGKDPSIWNKEVAKAEIILGWRDEMKNALDSSQIKWIQSWSAGVDSFPLRQFEEKRITLTSANGVHAYPISETVMALILSFTRKIHEYVRNQQEKKWHNQGLKLEIHNKTVGIFGVGAIGKEIAKICKSFNMKVIGVRNRLIEEEYFDQMYSQEQLEEVLPQCDFVVCALPLTERTHHLFNKSSFKLMKDTAFFVNIGRGLSVKEQDLIEALENGIIAGAGLDVFETEPLPVDSPLWEMEQVIITPHTAGSTEYYNQRVIQDIFLPNLQAYLEKKEQLPVNQVNYSSGY